MLSREDNERLTRVGPGTPMGELMRRYWIPAGFSQQIAAPDSPPVRVRLLGENLVMFRDSQGRVGLFDERCPHRTASMFFGRNEENGLRCVYHGLKFDVEGNCVDVPCIPQGTPEQMNNVKRALRIKSYPCVEMGEVIWTYMGPLEHKPEVPELEWAMLPSGHRYATRHIQQCNWLQGLDGGFDATHLSFLHSGAVDLRKGNTDHDRRVVPSLYESIETEAGFIFGTGRNLAGGSSTWHIEMMILPFHKIIPSRPLAAQVWAPIDDENTMLYSVNFNPHQPFTAEDLERETSWRGIHTENIPGTDLAVLNKANDYRIDRALQASGQSFTGLKGLGIQDCGMQESMGPIADRTLEHLLPSDAAMVRIRRRLLQVLKDQEAGKPLPGQRGEDYRVRATRFEVPQGAKFVDMVAEHVATVPPMAAQ